MRRALVVLAFGSVFALGACAQPGYDATKIQRQLRQAGLTAGQATCVTDGIDNSPALDARNLASRSDPTLKEDVAMGAISQKCGVSTTTTTKPG